MKMSQLLVFTLVCYCCTHFVTSQTISKTIIILLTCNLYFVFHILCVVVIENHLRVNQFVKKKQQCLNVFPNGTTSCSATWFTDRNVDVNMLSGHNLTDNSNEMIPANVTNVLIVTDVRISSNMEWVRFVEFVLVWVLLHHCWLCLVSMYVHTCRR